MSRGSLLNTLSGEEPTLGDVWLWYEFQRALVGEEKSRVLDAIAMGTSSFLSRYVGKTREELEADFAYHVDELGQAAALLMLASTEAALRVDFIARVAQKRKDPISRRFREISQEQGDKIRLEEDILDVWRDHSPTDMKREVSEFKGVLNLRHWLAHGRYWKPKLGRASGYDPTEVFEVCEQILKATEIQTN